MSLPVPATSARTPSEFSFAEVQALLGPQVIGDTADNTYAALYGRPYALILDAARVLRLYRGDPAGGSYAEVTSGLPSIVFGLTLPATARRFTAAFDQSARIIVAYEDGGLIYVTRWTGSEYVQNVTFSGCDPQLVMDATLADPRGYPTLADDGWSVREAFDGGIRVLFEWLAGDPVVWLENAIPDSDVLLFYLTPDRTQVQARVQRQLYDTPQLVRTYDQPVILDRAVALPGRYQLLVSYATGEPLELQLISDPYLGDYIIAPQASDALTAAAAPEAVRVENDTYATEDDDDLTASYAPEAVAVTGDTLFYTPQPEALTSDYTPEVIAVTSDTLPVTDGDDLDGGMTPEPVDSRVQVIPQEESDALDATYAPEDIRAQTV